MLSARDFDLLLKDFRKALDRTPRGPWLDGIRNMVASRLYLATFREDVNLMLGRFGGSVLDFGTGSGICAYVLARAGLQCVGIDISDFHENERHANMAAEQLALWTELAGANLSFQHYSKDIPYPDGHFSDVAAYAVIEHIPLAEVLGALSEIRRTTQPGGLLFVSRLPRRSSLAERLQRAAGVDCHDLLFTRREIETLMRAAGFDVERWEPTDFFPAYPAKIANALYPLLWSLEGILLKLPGINLISHHQRLVCSNGAP